MLKKILFATDFSQLTDHAESYTRAIASAMGATVTLLHSVEPIEDAQDDAGVARFLDAKRDTALRKATGVIERFKADGIECEVRVLVGKRWKVIIEQSEEFDLVILGSHKVEDGDKVYMGTTTHKVFFAINKPLLVVPSM